MLLTEGRGLNGRGLIGCTPLPPALVHSSESHATPDFPTDKSVPQMCLKTTQPLCNTREVESSPSGMWSCIDYRVEAQVTLSNLSAEVGTW